MVAGLFDLFEQGGHLGSPVAVMGQAAAVKETACEVLVSRVDRD